MHIARGRIQQIGNCCQNICGMSLSLAPHSQWHLTQVKLEDSWAGYTTLERHAHRFSPTSDVAMELMKTHLTIVSILIPLQALVRLSNIIMV